MPNYKLRLRMTKLARMVIIGVLIGFTFLFETLIKDRWLLIWSITMLDFFIAPLYHEINKIEIEFKRELQKEKEE